MSRKCAFCFVVPAVLGLWVGVCAGSEPGTTAAPTAPAAVQPAVPDSARCPVTGEDFKVTAETLRSTLDGKTYYFCCPSCKMQFDATPEKYLNGK